MTSDTVRSRAGAGGRPAMTLIRNEQPLSRREALIAAAITLFAERPYRDVSVDEIVERAGVAHGMVSYHFGGKQGLFSATVSYIWDDLVVHVGRHAEELQPDAAVRGYLLRHLDYVTRYPQRFAILSQAAQDNGDIKHVLEEAKVGHFATLVSAIGCRSRLDPGLLPVLRAWGAFVDQVTLDWSRGTLRDADAVADLCLQVLVTSVSTIEGFRFHRETQAETLAHVAETLEA